MDMRILSAFTPQAAGIDQLVAVRADLKLLVSSYAETGVPCPGWITEKLDTVEAQIKVTVVAQKKALLLKLQARRSQLATPDEKRKALDEEIAAMEKELA